MKRMLKRLGWAVLLFLGLLIGVTWLITSLYDDQIGRRVVSAVNEQLKTEMRLDGFDISLIRTFPAVGVNLMGVEIDGAQGGLLLEAKQLSFRLSLLSFLSRNYKLRALVISDAALSLSRDPAGNANYEIFKTADEDSGSGGETGIELTEARLKHVELHYRDQPLEREGVLRIQHATLSGEFSTRRFLMDAEAEGASRFWEQDEVRYLVGTPLALDAEVLVDLDRKLYELRGVRFEVGPNVFAVRGAVTTEEGVSDYDIHLSNADGSLGGAIELLPASYRKALGDLNSRGRFNFEADLKGKARKQEMPAITARFFLDRGRLTSSKLMEDLKDVTLEAYFSNGEDRSNRSSTLEVRQLVGYFNRERIEAQMDLRNLDNPYIDLRVDGALPLEAIYGVFDNPSISGGDGEIEVEQLHVRGRYEDMINTSRISRVEASGLIRFDDAALELNERKVLLDRGEVKLMGNLLEVRDLKLEGPGTELEFSGNAYNLLPVLFADSLNTQKAKLRFDANLEGESLDIGEMLGAMDVVLTEEEAEEVSAKEAQAIRAKQVQTRQRLTKLLNGAFQTSIEAFRYGEIEGRDFEGKLQVENNELSIYGTTKAMGGSFLVDGDLYFERHPRLVAELESRRLEASEFFRQAGDFGQSTLTHEHISGRLNARMAIMAFFDEMGRFDPEKLQVLASVRIADGELHDFEMLENFSAVLKHKDLERIRFSDLENYLEIRNQRLYLPVMYIQSSAANFTLSGEHTFSNEYLYHVKVNVLQAIGQKIRRHDPELRPIPARRNGFVNLYYQIRGDESDYEVRKAKRAVKEHFERTSQQRSAIQLALQQRFGMEVKPIYEPDTWEDIPEYRADPSDDSDEFMDWEIQGGR